MSDLTPREARMVYALLKIRQSQVKAAIDHVQQFTEQEPGDRNTALLGRARLGHVATTEPKVTAQVVDGQAFFAWVKATRPGEVETREEVRSSYQAALLGEITKRGVAVDSHGQEVPGVAFRQASNPYQRFDPADNAAELLKVVEPRDLPQIDGIDLAAILGVRTAEAGEQA